MQIINLWWDVLEMVVQFIAVCGMVPLPSLEGLKQWAMKFHAHLFDESAPKSQSELSFDHRG